jgi:hypothetical protein
MKKILLLITLLALVFSFEAKSQCGQISLVGEFGWEDDINMTQDQVDPDMWHVTINVTSDWNTEGDADIVFMKFREDGSWDVNWGADSFPTGTGTQNGDNIPVPLDTAAATTNYYVTFDCSTGEYSFMSTSVTATRAYAMTMDGDLGEPEWNLNNMVSKLIMGELTQDPNEIYFGVAYDDDSLYIGLDIKDVFPTIYEMGEVFIDGDKSGGPYDANDLHLRFNGPKVTIVQGPQDVGYSLGFALNPGVGYTAELALPLAAFGIAPTTELEVGFDIIIGDGDSGEGVDYMMAWTGDLANYEVTNFFGTLVFADFSGLNDYADYSSFVSVYPNPSSSQVTLMLSENIFNGNVTVQVSDITGRIIQGNTQTLPGVNNQVHLNVDGFTPGIYFVNVFDENGSTAVKKLVVR